jgi:hypothetical protein
MRVYRVTRLKGTASTYRVERLKMRWFRAPKWVPVRRCLATDLWEDAEFPSQERACQFMREVAALDRIAEARANNEWEPVDESSRLRVEGNR